ncbi:unnamed protein product [Discosporangium mesarthrocarpum]
MGLEATAVVERSGAGTREGNAARPSRTFLRRGSGRTAAGPVSLADQSRQGTESAGRGDDGPGLRRLALVPGEVCPVCQVVMDVGGGAGAGAGAVGAGEEDGELLTYCRDGCGNNMHTKCMRMYAEHRRSGKQKVCCPLCRAEWGPGALRQLQEQRGRGNGCRVGGLRASGSGGGGGGPKSARVVLVMQGEGPGNFLPVLGVHPPGIKGPLQEVLSSCTNVRWLLLWQDSRWVQVSESSLCAGGGFRALRPQLAASPTPWWPPWGRG